MHGTIVYHTEVSRVFRMSLPPLSIKPFHSAVPHVVKDGQIFAGGKGENEDPKLSSQRGQ